jgi:hypothetical protein
MKKQIKKKKEIDFDSLTKAQKRVVIAKDVIKQINAKQLIAKPGWYISLDMSDFTSSMSIKDNYSKIKECRVCALGACLMATTKFANVLNFSDIGRDIHSLDNDNVKKVFSEIFSPDQLLLIEQAFEGVSRTASRFANKVLKQSQLSGIMEDRCDTFFKKNGGRMFDQKKTDKSADDRLKAIMRNIVENNGTFQP